MIDTRNWGKFKIGNLFNKLDLKCRKKDFNKSIDCSEEKNDEFSLPLTNARHYSNGIQFYGRLDDWDSAEMTIDIVSNGAIATGDVYAQPQKTGVLWDSYLIKCIYDIQSEYVLHYIACVIEKCVKSHFGYDNKCTWDKVKEENIKLPITSNGKPDWAYMESYMKRIMKESEKSLENLKKADGEKQLIDTRNWGTFRIGDLFNKLDLKCRKEDFNKSLDCSEEKNDEFSLPLTNAKHFNNGIQFYGRPDDWDSAEMTIDIVSNGAIATGDVYAQPQKTGVLWDSYLIKCIYDIQSEYVLHYIACVIEKCVKSHFGYDNKCTWDNVKEENIKLPITSDGKPDWQYMENYMKNIMDNAEDTISALQSGLRG